MLFTLEVWDKHALWHVSSLQISSSSPSQAAKEEQKKAIESVKFLAYSIIYIIKYKIIDFLHKSQYIH